MEDTIDLRSALADSWRRVLDRFAERDYPLRAVVETMVAVGHERFCDRYGANAAASYLQLLAESLREEDAKLAQNLVSGKSSDGDGPAFDSSTFDASSTWAPVDDLLR